MTLLICIINRVVMLAFTSERSSIDFPMLCMQLMSSSVIADLPEEIITAVCMHIS